MANITKKNILVWAINLILKLIVNFKSHNEMNFISNIM
jgi:hypothetical protein